MKVLVHPTRKNVEGEASLRVLLSLTSDGRKINELDLMTEDWTLCYAKVEGQKH